MMARGQARHKYWEAVEDMMEEGGGMMTRGKGMLTGWEACFRRERHGSRRVRNEARVGGMLATRVSVYFGMKERNSSRRRK
jgi:hypothetical protein